LGSLIFAGRGDGDKSGGEVPPLAGDTSGTGG
jgi:hypothetical protein